MSETQSTQRPIEIALRVPGTWTGPRDLVRRLPKGWSIDDTRLNGPDGLSLEVSVLPADDEFPSLFATSCQREPSDRDKRIVEAYTVNVCPIGPGGSTEAVMAMLRAGVALLDAGGGGVFVDNSGLAHGSDDWRDLASDPSGDGAFWAMVAAVRTPRDVFSMGMHTLGSPDAVVPRTGDDEFDYFYLNNFLGYLLKSGRVMHEGDVVGEPGGRHFRATREPDPGPAQPGHPMHNPPGRWRLEPVDLSDN